MHNTTMCLYFHTPDSVVCRVIEVNRRVFNQGGRVLLAQSPSRFDSPLSYTWSGLLASTSACEQFHCALNSCVSWCHAAYAVTIVSWNARGASATSSVILPTTAGTVPRASVRMTWLCVSILRCSGPSTPSVVVCNINSTTGGALRVSFFPPDVRCHRRVHHDLFQECLCVCRILGVYLRLSWCSVRACLRGAAW